MTVVQLNTQQFNQKIKELSCEFGYENYKVAAEPILYVSNEPKVQREFIHEGVVYQEEI